MAWEKRKDSRKRYYYRSVRQGKRVVKQYFGAGLAGEIAASLDASAGRKREEQVAAVRESRRQYVEALEPLAVLEDCVGALMRDALASAGYEYRHGRWRICNAN